MCVYIWSGGFQAADVESLMSFLRTKQGKLTFINARSGKCDLVMLTALMLALGCKGKRGLPECVCVFGAVQGVSQISEDLFRCDVGTIGFLGFDVTPSLDLQVTVSENSCRLELVQCRVRESESCGLFFSFFLFSSFGYW